MGMAVMATGTTHKNRRPQMTYAYTAQTIADVANSADVLFDYLDDPASLG